MRYNVFRMLRDKYREYQSFGSPELKWIRREAEKLNAELEQLKVIQQQQQHQEEVMAKAAIRFAGHRIQHIQAASTDGKHKINSTVEHLVKEGSPAMEDRIAAQAQASVEAAIRAGGLSTSSASIPAPAAAVAAVDNGGRGSEQHVTKDCRPAKAQTERSKGQSLSGRQGVQHVRGRKVWRSDEQ